MDPLAIGLVLTWIVLAIVVLLVYQLMVLNGRLLLRVKALEQRSTDGAAPTLPDSGLPIGSVLLDFELPLLDGGLARFSAWRGRSVLLLFVGPQCPYSRQSITELGRVSAERPFIVIVSSGAPEENRDMFQSPGKSASPVLLQEGFEVAVIAHVPATPAAYLVDEQGRTSSLLALGLEQVLQLAGVSSGARQSTDGSATGKTDYTQHSGDPILARYGVEQQGLPVGRAAPSVQLPLLDGSHFSLDAYRGQTVLLVFVDPGCAASRSLLPRLANLGEHSTASTIVLISRGDVEMNREWARRSGVTSPMAIQRFWDVSQDFELVATPVAFLIDEYGIVAAAAAIGEEAILTLTAGQGNAPSLR